VQNTSTKKTGSLKLYRLISCHKSTCYSAIDPLDPLPFPLINQQPCIYSSHTPCPFISWSSYALTISHSDDADNCTLLLSNSQCSTSITPYHRLGTKVGAENGRETWGWCRDGMVIMIKERGGQGLVSRNGLVSFQPWDLEKAAPEGAMAIPVMGYLGSTRPTTVQ